MADPEMGQPQIFTVPEMQHRGIRIFGDDFRRDFPRILAPYSQIPESGQCQFVIGQVQARRAQGIPGESVDHLVCKGPFQPVGQVVPARCQDDFPVVPQGFHHLFHIVDQHRLPGGSQGPGCQQLDQRKEYHQYFFH